MQKIERSGVERDLTGPLLMLGSPDSRGESDRERIAADRHTLIAHAPDEVECVLSPGADDRGMFAAATHSTALATGHLKQPLNPEVLVERRFGVTEVEARNLPATDITYPVAAEYGMERSLASAILASIGTARRAVERLRESGHDGAIVLPGLVVGTYSVVVPRHFLGTEKLRATKPTLWHPVSRDAVEHTLNIRMLPMSAGWNQANPFAGGPR